MAQNRIRLSQIETGEFRGLISGVASEGYIPYIAEALENIYASSDTGTFAIFNIPLVSGASNYNIEFAETFNGTPTILPSMLCPSGKPFIDVYATEANQSGCRISFASGVANSGYRLQVIAIDTFLVTSGLASILDASSVGLDLITAPTVTLQRQILGVQALNEKNRANGYAGLNSNAQIDTGLLPTEFLNWDGGTGGLTSRNIQFKRGLLASLSSYVGLSGEPLFATDTKQLFIGDGVTPGGVQVVGSGGSVTNVVRTTGDQTISGDKSFVSNTFFTTIAGFGGGITINVQEGRFLDSATTESLNVEERTLSDISGLISVDFSQRVLSGDWAFNIDGGGF